uniref:Uncharacterized protein isoform X2 n=1 Tax=Nicotiana tabacum TaxID=4097 RepID=A0A1S4D2Y8_TOBAC|nr:PREDICTED: uncharacterized protein LOC107825306 isoform X2 [Nicotiana tabacum]
MWLGFKYNHLKSGYLMSFLPIYCTLTQRSEAQVLPHHLCRKIEEISSSPLVGALPHFAQNHMFTNTQRQEEHSGKYGTPRVEYLQELVTQFKNASSEGMLRVLFNCFILCLQHWIVVMRQNVLSEYHIDLFVESISIL